MKSLDEILIFTEVAQLGSFSRAAKLLQLPISTVSRKVSDLEKRVGIVLMQRTTRKLSLTKDGQKFFDQCALHIRGIEEAEAGLAQVRNEPEGLLRITVPIAMSQGKFISFVSNFIKAYPKVKIDLIATNQLLDLVSENIDIAIRFGILKNSSAIAKRLGESRRLTVATPKYLKEAGLPTQPKELQQHQCVLFKSSTEESEWNLVNGKNRSRVKISGSVFASDFNLVNEFTLHSHGIALLPELYCRDAIAAGKLVQVLPEWSSSATPVNAVYLNKKLLPQKNQLFLQKLGEWKSPYWQ